MNELQVFQNETFGQVRTLTRDGEPWFVAADVCKALEIKNPSHALRRLDEDERDNTLVLNEGIPGNPNMAIVSESGIYELILRSRKPEAKAFRRWIKSDVLPSIRKHGAYMTPEKVEEALVNPDTMLDLLTRLKDEQARTQRLEAANGELKAKAKAMLPKANYYDAAVARKDNLSIRETAKVLNIGEKSMVKFLLAGRYLYRDRNGKGRLMPYATHTGILFALKERRSDLGWGSTQTLVTPVGRAWLHRQYVEAH